MASRQFPPNSRKFSAESIEKGIARLKRVIEEIEAFDCKSIAKRWSPQQKALESKIEATLSSVFGTNSPEYLRYQDAVSLDSGPMTIEYDYFGGGRRDGAAEAREYVAEGKTASVLLLKSAIEWLEEERADIDNVEQGQLLMKEAAPPSRKIFVVHGHDEGARQGLARFIEKIGFEAIILSEQANQGRTIIEKIEAHADVGFAVVLLTPDDLGGKDTESLRPRARQNVLLELGYFMAKLTRARVHTLAKGDLEIPTDFAGVVWQSMDDNNGWQTSLARELQAAGYEIDWNTVMR